MLAVPEELFPQHKKESDAHKVFVEKGIFHQYQENSGKNWEYKSHGFKVWINFEGDIIFIIPCHWNPDHGEQTIIDIKEWIEKELGIVQIEKGTKVSW